jgi:hypothetical protein
VSLVLASAATLAACSSVPKPTGTAEGAVAAVRAVEEVGTQNEPKAALYLQLAKEQMQRGREFSEKGDKDRAAGFYMRAEADAEVALSLARAEQTRKEAQTVIEKLKEGTP